MAGVKRRAAVGSSAPFKKTRTEGDTTPAATATPSSPASATFTDHQAVAATSVTSRNTHQRPKKYLCEHEGCDKAFDRPVRLQAHLRTHTDERTFVCDEPECTKSFYKAEHLKAHWQNKHSNDASHICAYVLKTGEDGEECECGRAFTTATRLKRHLAIHEEREQTKCQEPGCGMMFRKMETLQRHIKKDHLNEKAYRCGHVVGIETNHESGIPEECGETFSTVSQLKAHKNREHSGPKHFCQVCFISKVGDGSSNTEMHPLGFETYAELQAHNKTVHPPTCSICGHVCESNRALAAHNEIEHCALSDRQKFKCTYEGCKRSFTRQGNLNVHVQSVHVKARKFICGEFDLSQSTKCPGWDGHGCAMGFHTKANLENHVRTQHLDLPLLNRKVKVKEERPFSRSQQASQPGAVSLLTGAGYEDTRPIECWDSTCEKRFLRDYDLAQHMELSHGWQVDDINDHFAELEALQGGKFWVGGQEPEFQEHVSPEDEVLREQLVGALEAHKKAEGDEERESGHVESKLEDGEAGQVVGMQDEQSTPAIDPALMALGTS